MTSGIDQNRTLNALSTLVRVSCLGWRDQIGTLIDTRDDSGSVLKVTTKVKLIVEVILG